MKRLILILLTVCTMTISANAQVTPKKVYDESINPNEQIDKALMTANNEGKFVICQVGGNWCPWCLKFADFMEKDSAIRQVVAENFVFIHVNYNPRRSEGQTEAAQAMMKRLNNPARFGFPVFVVLNGQGKVIHTQDSSFLEEGDGYNQKKTLRFFQNWTPKAVN